MLTSSTCIVNVFINTMCKRFNRDISKHTKNTLSNKSPVMTGLRRVDSLAARCLLSRGRNKRAMVSRQKQEYQRQSRDVNNTRQGSRSQAQVQVQSSKVGQSGVKHRDGRKNNAQNVSQGKTRLRTGWVFVCCFYVSEWMRCKCGEAIRVDEWMVTAVWLV